MRNIVLVGFMGTGKTTVGKLIAEQLAMPLVDMDALIEKQTGKTISELFAEKGEAHFRKLEYELAETLSAKKGHVISTGGGLVLNPKNIQHFEQSGLVVCLLASPETVLERVKNDTARPLLSGDKKTQIIQLLEARKPLYEAITHKIDTTGRPSPIPTAQEIIALYKTNNP